MRSGVSSLFQSVSVPNEYVLGCVSGCFCVWVFLCVFLCVCRMNMSWDVCLGVSVVLTHGVHT